LGNNYPGTTQEKILTLFLEQPAITRKKIAEVIGLSADGVKSHLAKLTAAGSIRLVDRQMQVIWKFLKPVKIIKPNFRSWSRGEYLA